MRKTIPQKKGNARIQKTGEKRKRRQKAFLEKSSLNQKGALKARMSRVVVRQRVGRNRSRGLRRLACQKKNVDQLMEIRQYLPDDAGKGNRRRNGRNNWTVNLQLTVFAPMVCGGNGIRGMGIVAATAAVGGLFMAGAGEQENLLMARAYGNHAHPAYDDQQKGEQHDAVAQCSNHGMGRIVKRHLKLVKIKVTDAGTGVQGEGRLILFLPAVVEV